MPVEGIVFGAVGLLLVVLGLVIWKKQKITLLHDYHWKNVRKRDVAAYTRLVGIGLIVMGAGVCLAGLVNALTGTQKGLLCFAAGFAAGMILMGKAQKKYNGSWF